MSIKDNVIFSLNRSRFMLEKLIQTMDSEKDWLFQVHPKANHPLWVVAHIGLADNLLIKNYSGDPGRIPDGWEELFWFGSEIHGDASKYPSSEECVGYCRERREKLMAIIDGLSDDFFEGPTPDDGMFAEAPNMAQMAIFMAYHEGVHSGQFTIAHRALGNEPMFKPQAESAS